MKASEVMTKEVLTISQYASLNEGIQMMVRNRISGLPVTDASGAMIGMLTEGDLLRRTELGTERKRPRWISFLLGAGTLAAEYTRSRSRRVKDVMTKSVIAVAPDTSIEEIVHLMEQHHIKRVPVVREDSLVGIVSRANLMQCLASMPYGEEAVRPSDDEIRERVWAELSHCEWAPTSMLNVKVECGVVHLHGVISNESERTALRVVAENIAGVEGVQDHLRWFDGLSCTFVAPHTEQEPMLTAVGDR